MLGIKKAPMWEPFNVYSNQLVLDELDCFFSTRVVYNNEVNTVIQTIQVDFQRSINNVQCTNNFSLHVCHLN